MIFVYTGIETTTMQICVNAREVRESFVFQPPAEGTGVGGVME